MKAGLLFFLPLFASGCTTTQPILYPMTFEECAEAKFCTVSGNVTARAAEHAWMGELELPDGRCVSVSLPRAELADLRENGPRRMTVQGQVFGDPSGSIEFVTLEIEGRKIGLGLCGDFFVFVSGRS
ncbi:MAG: hypothetical protein ABJP48_06945 [Erythrobacter sp.]